MDWIKNKLCSIATWPLQTAIKLSFIWRTKKTRRFGTISSKTSSQVDTATYIIAKTIREQIHEDANNAYLTDSFFICIDSDLRLLRGEEGLSAVNHIAQTYAYSWENHLCESSHLSKGMEQIMKTRKL